MSKTATRRVYADPMGAFLRVEYKELQKLDLTASISQHSFMKDQFVYLSDLSGDAQKYAESMESLGTKLKVVRLERKRGAKLRNYAPYHPLLGESNETEQSGGKARSEVQSSSGDAGSKAPAKARPRKAQKTVSPRVTPQETTPGEASPEPASGDKSYLETGMRFASSSLRKNKIREGDTVVIREESEDRVGVVQSILSEQITVLMEDTGNLAFFFQKGLNIKKVA